MSGIDRRRSGIGKDDPRRVGLGRPALPADQTPPSVTTTISVPTIQIGDRPDLIAERYLGDPFAYRQIVDANPDLDIWDPKVGDGLLIPAGISGNRPRLSVSSRQQPGLVVTVDVGDRLDLLAEKLSGDPFNYAPILTANPFLNIWDPLPGQIIEVPRA